MNQKASHLTVTLLDQMKIRIFNWTLRVPSSKWQQRSNHHPVALVLIHDDTPRINWRLAVVKDTISGEDGLIRAAKIRTSTGKTNRPVTKLYPLGITAADPLPRLNNLPMSSTSSNNDSHSSR